MKTLITTCMCLLSAAIVFGQETNLAEKGLQTLDFDQRTPALNLLYQEAKILAETGTAEEINANRLAIKAEWQNIDPAIAALYKPVDVNGKLPEISKNIEINGVHYPDIIKTRPEYVSSERPFWVDDILVYSGYVDGGLDMEIAENGDIYISGYTNNILFGGTTDDLFIYRSTDDGNTFQEFDVAEITATMQKMELILIDGAGNDYLLAYFLTDSQTFQVVRWDITNGGAYSAQVIATGVTDFGVDRNFPNTAAQRVFAVYYKSADTNMYSARSSAGSYGFDWVDEFNFSGNREQLDFAYGLNGGCYSTGVGPGTGNLYVSINNDYNDPASWSSLITAEQGSSIESLNPVIVATRKEIPNEEVLVIVSSRAAGSSDDFDLEFYRREAGGSFLNSFSIVQPGISNMHANAWVERVASTEEIRIGYIEDDVDNSEDDQTLTANYPGDYPVISFGFPSDPGIDVWEGYAPVVEETIDNYVCMAFAGTDGSFAENIYFDGESPLLSVQTNAIEGLVFGPNPTKDVLKVSALGTIDRIELYSMLGKKAKSLSPDLKEASINTTNLAAGIYLMKITVNGKTGTYKIIKQ